MIVNGLFENIILTLNHLGVHIRNFENQMFLSLWPSTFDALNSESSNHMVRMCDLWKVVQVTSNYG